MGEPDAVNLEEEKREEYRHVYPPAIGSIGCGVGRVMEKILAADSFWFLTRQRVEPCRDCVYNRLCCPVSDYKLGMQKFNLCRMGPRDLQNN